LHTFQTAGAIHLPLHGQGHHRDELKMPDRDEKQYIHRVNPLKPNASICYTCGHPLVSYGFCD